VTTKNEEDTLLRSVALQNAQSILIARERAQQRSEFYLAEGQRLAHMGSWAFNPSGFFDYWSPELFQIYGLDPAQGAPTLNEYLATVHPQDRELIAGTIEKMLLEGSGCDVTQRILRPHGALRHIRWVGVPAFDEGVVKGFVGTAMDVTEQENLTQELRRREAYLAEAQRLSHTGSFGWRISTGEIIWSEETFRIFQYDRATKPTVELVVQRVHPEDADLVKQTIERASREGKDFDHEYRLVMPDGFVKHVHVVAHAFSDESGTIEFVGAVMDVTEQHQARVALERVFDEINKSQARLQLVIDTIPTMVWSALPDGSVDFLSRSLIEYHGFTLEDLGRGGWSSLIHPEDLALLADKWRAAFSAGEPYAYEFRARRADGEYRWILSRAVPLRDELGHIIRWYGASIDIDDRKQAEQELRKSEEQWRDVFENNPTMYFMVDAAGTVLSVNPFGAEQLGYQVAELVDQPVLSVFHESDREAVQRNMASCLEQLGRARSWEARKVRKDGKVRWVRETAKAVPRVNGPIVLVACEDITEQKRAEEALRQAQADLARVSRVTTMGELTASLAHEVNQPIAAAVTNANACLRWLAGDAPNLEEARAAAMRIVKDGKRAAGVISRIRLLFKKGTPEREEVDVNEVIREMIVLLRNETTRYSISVRMELAPGLPQVMGDRVQLQQVMMNLIMNGIDAMKDVDGARDLAIKSERAENEQLIVSVSDTGVGLPPRQADQIFNAFFTTKPHGTGMGLSISRSIVESHGGRLWAADDSRRGACFCFTLPTRAEAHEDAHRPSDGLRH